MTPLAGILAARIAATGPISVAEYMAECLMHPRHGYYSTRDPFGQAGDFTTAPEISQMFGELIGLFLAQCWLDQGCPDPFVLAEIGPGRGTLMADALRAMRTVPGLVDAARLHLVETSPTLRARQAATLGAAVTAWHDRVEDLPEGPLYLVANEFFDALPIRQFLRSGSGWRERHVTVTEGRLAPAFGPETRYGELTMPVGVFFGTADRVVNFEENGAWLEGRVANLDLEVLEGVGHMPHYSEGDKAEAFIRRMAAKAFGA